MVGGFEVGANLFEGEPGGLKFSACIQGGLICVMATFWMATGAEGVDRQSTHPRSKLYHAHIGGARNSIEALQSGRCYGVKGKHGAVRATDAGNRQTRARIIKLFTLAFIKALEPVELAPGHAPGAESLLEGVEGFAQRRQTSFRRDGCGRVSLDSLSPAGEDRCRNRAGRSAVIPGRACDVRRDADSY